MSVRDANSHSIRGLLGCQRPARTPGFSHEDRMHTKWLPTLICGMLGIMGCGDPSSGGPVGSTAGTGGSVSGASTGGSSTGGQPQGGSASGGTVSGGTAGGGMAAGGTTAGGGSGGASTGGSASGGSAGSAGSAGSGGGTS